MRSGWFQPIDVSVRGMMPFLFGVLLVFAMLMPWRLPGFGAVTPQLVLMSVFYWTIYRPDRLPYTATFVLGLAQDILTGNPIGITPLILLAAQAVVLSQRRFFSLKAFPVVWWGFAMVAVAAGIAGWLVASAFFAQTMAFGTVAMQTLLTILLYPPMTWLLGRLQMFIGRWS